MKDDHTKYRDEIALSAVFLALLSGLLPIGGIYAWGPFAALLSAVVGLVVFGNDRFRRNRTIKGQMPFFLVGLAAVISLVQALPVPIGIIRTISPQVYSKLTTLYGLAGIHLTRHSIAFRPDSALFSVNKFLAAGFIFLLAMNLAHRRKRGILVATILISIGIMLEIVALLDVLVTPGTVLGIYTPSQQNRPWMVSLLINPNNLSAVLNLTGFTAMGLYMRTEKRLGYLLTAIILEVGAMLTLSRAGLIGAVTGTLFFVLLMVTNSRHHLSVWVISPLLVAVFVIFMFAFSQSRVEIGTTGTAIHAIKTRLSLVGAGIDAFRQAPVLGIGQMGFGDFYGAFSGMAHRVVFFFIENGPTQLLADFGAFGLFILLMFSAWFAHQLIITKKDGPTTGIIVGLVILFTQNLVDFDIEMPGVLFMVFAALGVLHGMGATKKQPLKIKFFRSFKWRKPHLYAAVITAVLISTGVFVWGPSRMVDTSPGLPGGTAEQGFITTRLTDDFLPVPEPVSASQLSLTNRYNLLILNRIMVYRRLEYAMEKTVFNPGPYLNASSAMAVASDMDGAVNLARAALFSDPLSVRYRLFLVNVLTGLGRVKQAAQAARPLLATHRDMNRLIQLLTSIPKGLEVAALLSGDYSFAKAVKGFLYYRDRKRTKGFCSLVLMQYPDNCVCRAYMAMLMLKEKRIKTANLESLKLIADCPDKPEGFVVQSRVLLAQGRKTEAYFFLLEAKHLSHKSLSLGDQLQIAALQAQLGYFKQSRQTLSEVRRRGRFFPWVQVRTHLLESLILMKEGKTGEAMSEIEAAVRTEPDNEGVLNKALHFYLKIGALRKAADMAHRLYTVTGKSVYKKREDAIRRQLQMRLLKQK